LDIHIVLDYRVQDFFPLSSIVKRTCSRNWFVPPVVGRRGGTYWGSAIRKG